MEEQGIGGVRNFCGGSLSRPPARIARAFLLAAALSASFAARAGALEADITVDGYDLVVGQSFSASILLYPSEPGNATLTVEGLPPTFSPRESRKERRYLSGIGELSADRVSATLFEGQWAVTTAGTYTVGPFVLSDGDERLILPAITVTVADPLPGEFRRLGWAVGGSGALVGAKTRLRLEAFFPGELVAVSCPATEGALLEAVFLAAPGFRPDAKAGGANPDGAKPDDANPDDATVAEFDWTPLVAGLARLPAAYVDFRARDGSIARLFAAERFVKVSESTRPKAASADAESAVPGEVSSAFREAPSRPADDDGSAVVPLLDRPSDDPALREADALWRERETGKALAALRRAEYRSPFPLAYSSVRRAAERAIGIESAFPVPPAAWKGASVIGAVLLACLAFATRLASLSRPSLSRPLRVLFAVAMLASAAFAFLAVYAYAGDARPAAVVVSGELRRVPEDSSRVVGALPQGDAVRVYGRSGAWLFVRNGKAMEGWLRAEGVEFYSGGTKP